MHTEVFFKAMDLGSIIMREYIYIKRKGNVRHGNGALQKLGVSDKKMRNLERVVRDIGRQNYIILQKPREQSFPRRTVL